MKSIYAGLLASFLLTSCVSSKVHNELKKNYDELLQNHDQLNGKYGDASKKLTQCEEDFTDCQERAKKLQSDTSRLGFEVRKMKRNYSYLNRSYEFLLENNNALLSNSARENKAMLERLQELDFRLQDKQDSLDSERAALVELNTQLEQRSKRVRELEKIISKQDSVVRFIKNTMSNALRAYEGKGLTVESRNGKVYISMENSLLFPSASWTVNDKAKAALGVLAQALADNKELQITVEGNTDNDAFNGKTMIKDNWDLSVMRSTAVIKALLENKGVDPKRIVASGRSEYLPLVKNDSDVNKAVNRRTEVIITPDLSELNRLMEQLD